MTGSRLMTSCASQIRESAVHFRPRILPSYHSVGCSRNDGAVLRRKLWGVTFYHQQCQHHSGSSNLAKATLTI
jgi:hypothetical protein